MGFLYVLDTSSWIALEHNYPQQVFSTLWGNMEKLISSRRIVCPQEVRKEIKPRHGSTLLDFCKKNRIMFQRNSTVAELTLQIVRKHPYLVDSKRPWPSADPFVIGLARQSPLASPIIVTEEGQKSGIKIPHVARTYGIDSFKLLDMIREERWTF